MGTDLPATSFKHLGQAQFVTTTQTKQRVDLSEELIQEAHRHCSPFNNNIVVGGEHGYNLHVWLTLELGVAMILRNSTLCILGLQS